MSENRDCICATCTGDTTSGEPPRPAVADPLHFAHGAIRARLLARIASTELAGTRPLAGLTTRDPADPTIALIDSWAGALHILAWNTRRLHEDGNFHQSRDPEAMAAHAAMLGYELRPILAAQTVQTFTVDEFSGLEGPFQVPAGTSIASVPEGEEAPQIFTTDEALEARRAWNSIPPVRHPQPPRFDLSSREALVEGNATGVQVGDSVLLADGGGSRSSVLLARVTQIEPAAGGEAPSLRTRLALTPPRRLHSVPPAARPGEAQIIVLGRRAGIFGAAAPDYALLHPQDEPTMKALRMELKDAPSGDRIPRTLTASARQEWPNFVIAAPPERDPEAGRLDLDAAYPEALPGRVVLFDAGSTRAGDSRKGTAPQIQLGAITASEELARSDYALAQRVTRVTVGGLDLSGVLPGGASLNGRVRESSVRIETQRLPLVVPWREEPLPRPGEDDRLLLQGEHPLPPGRLVIVTGDDTQTGESHAQVARVKSAEIIAPGQTRVIFEAPLGGRVQASSLGLHANCVTASNAQLAAGGQWEVLGSGVRGIARPAFPLAQAPLAYLSAANARGYAPAIEVRVDGRRYTWTESLYEVDPAETVYTLEALPGGGTQVRFAGPLPSGLNNVLAFYRHGGGARGNLAAGRITTILSPVVGIAASSNPVPAEGGMDAETLEDIRRAAPRSTAALGRVVSRHDYEAFARGFRGVGKALATQLSDGITPFIWLTLATTEMQPPTPGGDLETDLARALAEAAPPGQMLRIAGFAPEPVTLVAALRIDTRTWRRSDIEQALRAHLANRFGPAAMDFGQPLRASAILAAIHEVTGITAARIETLDSPSAVPGLADIPARLPHRDPAHGEVVTASLLFLTPETIRFMEMAS
ncbi:baseplate J/gp47 family protein [Novosphingobium mangrovi (ex Hu et al. 2023)]|uniref:Baseplate J/gp47 family protein n=1 Tax=Novosphingobium mangrovi (ex Hu et al. 2023) TaxID=2930094 RepID=A0ABT0ABB4_9SPHN|nr:baseplate J/gp47 family protein [Novosphingobium mangrovi (ex Hu et al. 2023)]MCJ1960493.1 baseplate J/gp47 family protein [Novosphingobium mangrovi (ex Hu et al. 2023)]